jgi:hypothetical protein
LGCPGGCGEQPEQQQCTDGLGRLAGGRADQGEEAVAEQADRHPPSGGHGAVDAGEQQRWGHGEHGGIG